MGITKYQKEVSPGVFKAFYLVIAEGINRYTAKRVQKKRSSIPSLIKAERIYRELWSQCREERPDGLSLRTWGELIERYFEYISAKVRSPENPSGFNPKTIATKQSRLAHVEEWASTHLDLISPIFVTEYLDRLEQNGTSRMTTVTTQQEVKCVFSYAVELGILKSNPLANMKARKVPKRHKMALTHDEVDKLLLEAKRRDHPYYFVWLMTLITGLRRSELAGLKWSDLDLENGLIQVRRQLIPREGMVEFTKDKEERMVAVPTQTIPILKEHRLKAQSEFVISINCTRWEKGRQAEVLREFCQEIGIKEVTHHQLRATYITLAIIDGIPLGIVKENVGHAKLSTTDGYFRSSGVQLRGQADGLKIRIPPERPAKIRELKAVK